MTTTLTAKATDLSTCDREPIQIPGSIQPHGFYIALHAEKLSVCQLSTNVAELFQRPPSHILDHGLGDLLGASAAECILRESARASLDRTVTYLCRSELFIADKAVMYTVIGHRVDGLLVLEFERSDVEESASFRSLHMLVGSFLSRLKTVADVQQLSQLAAEEARRITDFDRVLIYQFDEDYHGVVVAESRNDRLPSYLQLRFPSSDIPQQARELYRLNRLRIISDADYTPVPLQPPDNPVTGTPTDMTYSVLRSVSPIHVEYMKNMGMASSMSISIMREDRLWGLVSCHHKTAKTVPFEVRSACDFLAQIFSLQLSGKEDASTYEYRVRLKSVMSRLLAHMAAAENFADGLTVSESDLLGLADAQGAAVLFDDQCLLVGQTPAEGDVRRLASWLASTGKSELFHTDHLSAEFPAAARYEQQASGLLAISISRLHQSYVLWFRPEVVKTVNWGGDPRKPVQGDGPRLHPRKSFELWKETVRSRSLPWKAAEIETAAELRNVILGIVLRKAEEMADITRELERSNKELEAFSYSVSHDLRAPFRHIVGYSELLRELKGEQLDSEGRRYIDTIIDSALFAGTLVDNLLAFSQMGRSSLNLINIDMNRLIAEVQADVQSEAADRAVEWHIANLPHVEADPLMLKLAVRNLLSNAVKYSRNRELAVITVTAERQEQQLVFHVADNGIGFDMNYVGKLFGVFQRLHRMEEFEGTGIGLANVRRIINRHGGEAWAKGAVGQGATFSFSLPIQRKAGL